MAKRYEWQERRGGRRYVRIEEPDAPVRVSKAAVKEAEAVPEIKIEADGETAVVAVPKRGRPPKAEAKTDDE